MPPLLVRGSQASLWLAIAISDSISHVFFVLMPTLKTIWGQNNLGRCMPMAKVSRKTW